MRFLGIFGPLTVSQPQNFGVTAIVIAKEDPPQECRKHCFKLPNKAFRLSGGPNLQDLESFAVDNLVLTQSSTHKEFAELVPFLVPSVLDGWVGYTSG